MKLAVLSDIHGNLPALEAVLADAEVAGATARVDLGDIVSGPLWPRETAERLMALDLPTIAGNHERQLLRGRAGRRMGASDAFAAAALTEAQWAWLAALPASLRLDERVLMVHGTPSTDLVYLLETVMPGFDLRERAAPSAAHRGLMAADEAAVAGRLGDVMRGVPGALVLCGHSHVPRAVALGDGRLVVNPGSVGLQAYDHDVPHPHLVENATPHARYALVSATAAGWQVELRAVPYDHLAAARRAEDNARADWADALRTGRVGRLGSDLAPAR